ncbi:MAG: PilZ domain-containing protein [Acidobacteria bacterium]|nr:PilZ domain-containing protein [Acidobacteriota bacterium]MBI3663106.1 PilZ domain-containing protein [Acidobacteriota bacterium]
MSAAREKRNVFGVESASPEVSPLSRLSEASLPGRGAPPETAAERPRVFARVPTHSFGMALERRYHPRAALRLPLRLTEVNHVVEAVPITLLTKNISSSGVYFLAPKRIEPGTPIELEVGLVERPLGRGGVRMRTVAHVVRTEDAPEPGWHGMAARFDDIAFQRDEELPPRFLK